MSQTCKIAFTAVLISLISLCSISCSNNVGGDGDSGEGNSGTYTFLKDGYLGEGDYMGAGYGNSDVKCQIFMYDTGMVFWDGDKKLDYMYLITEIVNPIFRDSYKVNDLYYDGWVECFETNSWMDDTGGALGIHVCLGPAPAPGESKTYQYADKDPDEPKGNVTVTNNISKNNTLEVKFFK